MNNYRYTPPQESLDWEVDERLKRPPLDLDEPNPKLIVWLLVAALLTLVVSSVLASMYGAANI